MKGQIKQKDFIFMSQRQRTSPFPNYMSMESMGKEMKRFTGQTLDKMLCIWQGNILFAFPHKKSFEKAGLRIAEKLERSPGFAFGLVTKQKKFGRELVNFTKKANKEISGKTSNKQLYQMFADYEKKYKSVYGTYGWVWVTEDVFAAKLLKIVEKKIKDNPVKAVDDLKALTK